MAARVIVSAAICPRASRRPTGPGQPSRTARLPPRAAIVTSVIGRQDWSATPAFDHAIAGLGDCKSCHAVQSATQTDWSGGSFSHVPAPTTCIGCHLAQRPVTATTSGFDHSKTALAIAWTVTRVPGSHGRVRPAMITARSRREPAATAATRPSARPPPSTFPGPATRPIRINSCIQWWPLPIAGPATSIQASPGPRGLFAQPESGAMHGLSPESASRWPCRLTRL